MNFNSLLQGFPASATALVTIDHNGDRRVYAFGEIEARAAGLSGALADRGVSRGDVVMTLVGNRIEWVLSMLACFRIGAIALPCNTQLRRGDIELRQAVAAPKLVIAEERLGPEIPPTLEVMSLAEVARALDEDRAQAPPAEPAELAPSDPCLLVFTSGTTGEARAALHPQSYLFGQATQAEHWFGARHGDLAWCAAASGWSKSARNAFVAPWLRGAAALLHDGRFDPAERLEICAREQVNLLCQSPTEYRMMAKRIDLHELPAMRRMVSAGEPLNPEVIRVFRTATGLDINDGYGQTEIGAITGSLVDQPVRDGSMGLPLPGIKLRVEQGELQIAPGTCPTFFSGYLDVRSGLIPPPLSDDGWWATGDEVRRDDNGYLWYQGRRDDVIVSSGYRIGPFEVESALLSHPDVAEAAVVAAPDPERGAVVRAIVVPRGVEPSEQLADRLRAHVRAVTAPYKYPRIVEFATELPKTTSGKIKRAELRIS